jgi:hypothetical protein
MYYSISDYLHFLFWCRRESVARPRGRWKAQMKKNLQYEDNKYKEIKEAAYETGCGRMVTAYFKALTWHPLQETKGHHESYDQHN